MTLGFCFHRPADFCDTRRLVNFATEFAPNPLPIRTAMMLKRLILLIFLLTPRSALAQDNCMDPSHLGPDHYMHPSQVDLVEVLGPPPAPASPQGQEDLHAVIEAQRTRTPEAIAEAKTNVCLSIFAFADVMGPAFQRTKLPFTTMFFQRIFDDGMHGVAAAKKTFNRQRPFVADKQITTVVPQPANASYPSGHATFAYMTAILLAAMVPEKAPAIFARAAAFAHSRLVAGVHYPSDLAAGRVAAAVIDNVLLHDTGFKADLAKARIEVRAAALPSP
jgi:acid phosphatase (class A)